MKIYDFEGAGYTVSSLGYMVSKVWGTWFREYVYILSRIQGT